MVAGRRGRSGILPNNRRGSTRAVWARLQTFPHVFEVAAATRTLHQYDLNGNRSSSEEDPRPLKALNSQGWIVNVSEFREYLQNSHLGTDLLYFFVQALQGSLPPGGMW